MVYEKDFFPSISQEEPEGEDAENAAFFLGDEPEEETPEENKETKEEGDDDADEE